MSNFPRSPKVLKGAIVGIDIFNPVASIVVFQYNPAELSRSVAPKYAEAGGDKYEALRLGGAPKETITASIKLDVVDQLEEGNEMAASLGLYPQISALEMLVYPKSALVIANTVLLATGTIEVVPPMAPLTLFIYGWKRVVPVKVTSLSISETAHDPTLNPIRASVDVSMDVLTYDDMSLLHPGYWAFLAHQVEKEVFGTIASVMNLDSLRGDDVDVFKLSSGG